MKRIAVLFANEWDREELGRPRYAEDYEFVFAGTNFFKLPGALALLRFDAVGFVESLARRFEKERVDGVLSSDEYLGAAIAAAVAKKLGLPGADPGCILRAQHKHASRIAQAKVVPEAVPKFALVPIDASGGAKVPLAYPFFVKPIKGTFSLFASKVASDAELRKHFAFRFWERFALGRVTRPFNDLVRAYTDIDVDALAFLGEELVEGVQVTLDGFAFGGEVEIMGVVDSVMFPGTSTFERFDYPSRMLSADVQARMTELAKRLVHGLGIEYGQFNVEMFYDAKTDSIRVIEINPRLSYQFADLYENVDGTDTYGVLLDLTLGRRPRFRKGAGPFKFAASFVLRTFQGRRIVRIPAAEDVARFAERYDEARIRIYGKHGTSLASEMRALGSYRYGIVNVGAGSLLDLFSIYNDALEQLPFKFA